MIISEIFYSIQGEGQTIGTPAVFLRMFGCNLFCPYCDTSYSHVSFTHEDRTSLNIQEVARRIKKYRSNTLVITGGEPLLQWDEIFKLCTTELAFLKQIIIETNALVVPHIEKVLPQMYFVCSPKFYSKESWSIVSLMDFFGKYSIQSELKMLLEGPEDMSRALSIVERIYATGDRLHRPVTFQPCIPRNCLDKDVPEVTRRAYYIYNTLAENFPCGTRFIVQSHKWIWGVNRRGV